MRFCVPALGICLFFHVYRYATMISQAAAPSPRGESFSLYNLRIGAVSELLSRLTVVIGRFIDDLFFSNNWNIVWFILLISLLRLIRIRRSLEVTLLVTALGLFFGIYAAAYTLTQHYYWVAYTDTVLSRCILHFFPLATILIILINFTTEENKN